MTHCHYCQCYTEPAISVTTAQQPQPTYFCSLYCVGLWGIERHCVTQDGRSRLDDENHNAPITAS